MTSQPPTDAYVDGSALLAVAFEERDGPYIARRLAGFTTLLSSNLLEAEMRGAFVREGREFDVGRLSRILWVFPDRSLGPEIAAALRVRYLRSSDLWHIATALYAARTRRTGLAFITLDHNQRDMAAGLGFVT